MQQEGLKSPTDGLVSICSSWDVFFREYSSWNVYSTSTICRKSHAYRQRDDVCSALASGRRLTHATCTERDAIFFTISFFVSSFWASFGTARAKRRPFPFHHAERRAEIWLTCASAQVPNHCARAWPPTAGRFGYGLVIWSRTSVPCQLRRTALPFYFLLTLPHFDPILCSKLL